MTTWGAKRAATSDPASPLPSKRVMAGPATLDPRRAETARKYMRALNTQFVSWVQLQYENHPAELWEDGLKDYISHASDIKGGVFPSACDVRTRADITSKHVRALNTQFASWVQLQYENHPAELWEDGLKDYISHASDIMDGVYLSACDVRTRADIAGKHVRALNAQFASWVQLHMQNNPAELWEDGLNDYISHASDIMEKFKDVVSWLRKNQAGSTAISSPSPLKGEKITLPSEDDSKSVAQPISDNVKKAPIMASSSLAFQNSNSQNNFSFISQQQTPAFSVSQSLSTQTPALFSMNQQSVFSGNQNTSEVPADADKDSEPETPSSPSVKKAEEKGIVVVYEAKCKVYVKQDDPTKVWKDIGVGQLSVRSKEGAEKASRVSTPTIVIRNDVGKILLNALIYKGIKMSLQKNTLTCIFYTSDTQSSGSDSGPAVARTYLFRLKNQAVAAELSRALKENAPLD